jgi:hypothetical protein
VIDARCLFSGTSRHDFEGMRQRSFAADIVTLL